MAEGQDVGGIPHNPMGAIATAAWVHLDAALHNVPVQEYPGDEWVQPKLDLVPEPLEFDDGYLVVRDTPGLGVELNDEAVRHYPPVSFDRAPVINRDGSLRDY